MKSLRGLKIARGITHLPAKAVRGLMASPQVKRSKYSAQRTEVDGLSFASKKEAKRYAELRDCQRAGLLRDLRLQPRYPLMVNNIKVATYVGDFEYTDCETGEKIIEDCKGYRTETYKLKKKFFEALYGMDIVEV